LQRLDRPDAVVPVNVGQPDHVNDPVPEASPVSAAPAAVTAPAAAVTTPAVTAPAVTAAAMTAAAMMTASDIEVAGATTTGIEDVAAVGAEVDAEMGVRVRAALPAARLIQRTIKPVLPPAFAPLSPPATQRLPHSHRDASTGLAAHQAFRQGLRLASYSWNSGATVQMPAYSSMSASGTASTTR
jgi:hypothetical protein